jgi:hypothetical protein
MGNVVYGAFASAQYCSINSSEAALAEHAGRLEEVINTLGDTLKKCTILIGTIDNTLVRKRLELDADNLRRQLLLASTELIGLTPRG